jgi:hypothetical protein
MDRARPAPRPLSSSESVPPRTLRGPLYGWLMNWTWDRASGAARMLSSNRGTVVRKSARQHVVLHPVVSQERGT